MDRKIFIKNLEDNFKLNSNLFVDVNFENVNIEPSNFTEAGHPKFGEKDCLLYTAQFSILNVNFSIKFLSFVYTRHGEILKLDIAIHNGILEKEIRNCRNFLQRKRNLNLTFETLSKIANLHEARRLICSTVLEKDKSIFLQYKEEGGILIQCYSCDRMHKLIEVHWAIMWNVEDCKISDFVEFFCSCTVLEEDPENEIRAKLEILAKVDLDFHSKLKLWKSLISDLHKNDVIEISDILEISDSEESDSSIVVLSCTPMQDTILCPSDSTPPESIIIE